MSSTLVETGPNKFGNRGWGVGYSKVWPHNLIKSCFKLKGRLIATTEKKMVIYLP